MKITTPTGTTYFFKDESCMILHRIDGPAVIYKNGKSEWWQEGLLHRVDGPAIEHCFPSTDEPLYYINGRHIEKELFFQLMRIGNFA